MKAIAFPCALLLALSMPLQAAKYVVCGVEWVPFTIPGGGGFDRGVTVEVHTEAFKRIGSEVEFRNVPWERCKSSVAKGEYTALMDGSADPAAGLIVGPVPNAFYPTAIFVRKDFPGDTFSWEAMKGKTVGTVRGYEYSEKVEKFTGWRRDEATNDEQSMDKLKGKRYDYLLTDTFTAMAMSKKLGFEVKMLKPALSSQDLFLNFAGKDKDLAEKHGAALRDMIKDGTMDRIYRKYLPYGYTDLQKQVSAIGG
ncbi:substrate-binding periplasmic protein [Chitinimonas koreensis]|uniref:substrate-binding periplasmic protein n=1 Tax=Chitinimonas koreensis TaxID=356302 RepID=UPI0003F83033|nr:transporter substrate-binding domain-containing protein [Chitinimonas koreensis]QNM97249.1 transporter substrate-binding domain-containing protein [Chitinimonas koreensis]